jgi:rare lipoprotein A
MAGIECHGLAGRRRGNWLSNTVFETYELRQAFVFCAITFGMSFGASATEFGLASYYGAAGLTAAHRSLPMGSRVKVLNLDNGRSVILSIMDRGPFIRGRVIDVSTAAAVALGFRDAGLAHVKIDAAAQPTGRKTSRLSLETIRPRPFPARAAGEDECYDRAIAVMLR